MASELFQKFKAELSSVHDSKSLSKNKVQDITKAAIKAKGDYKNVVYSVEKMISKSKPQHRLNFLYIIDSIVRASKHQLKSKDVFGPRFLKVFDKILDRLLECGLKERLRVVRTLNLWMSNKVFADQDVQPLREKCKRAGLTIDFEEVETAVKGSQADMSLYNGQYKKKQKKPHESTTPNHPPPEDGLLGAGPSSFLAPVTNLPTFALSEEYHNGTISEREMLELSRQFLMDRTGILSKDRAILQKTLQKFSEIVNLKVAEAQEEQRKKAGSSIQNVLTKDFEYSDDEEEKEKEPEAEVVKPMTHDEIFALAQKLISVPTIAAQLNEIFTPVVPVVNQMKEDLVPTSLNPLTLGQPPNLLALQSMAPLASQQLGFPNITGLNASQLLNMHNAQNLLLQQRAAQLQVIQNIPSAQHNLLLMGNPLINAFGVPTGVNPLLADLQGTSQQPPPLLADLATNGDKKPDLAADSKGKTKESRERRKMGLPTVKPGHTLIASRTLWLKKVPSNVTEQELKQSVESCGEASRVKIIGNRACAFITMETRKAANEVVQKLREVSISRKLVKVYWARGPGMDTEMFTDLWDSDRGVWEIPFDKLPADLVTPCEGAVLDLESLPEEKKGLYKENGERTMDMSPVILRPLPPAAQAPAPPLGFPFAGMPLGSFPPNFNGSGAGNPKPPGVPPLLNLSVPPPGGLPPGFPPPPPGVQVPPGMQLQGIGRPPPGMPPPQGVRHPPPPGVPPPNFDPNKPPPMQGFNTNAPPPPFGQGRGAAPPPMQQFNRPGMPPQMPPFRGNGRGNGPPAGGPPQFDSRRMPFRPDGPPREREGRGAPLLDQREAWNREQREQRERERDRSQGDRRRYDGENGNGNRRRVSRWGDDERRDDNSDSRRRSPERRRRSPSHSREQEPVAKKSSGDEETVSSTTVDELKPADVEPKPAEQQQQPVPPKPEEVREDQTDEVPMDLE